MTNNIYLGQNISGGINNCIHTMLENKINCSQIFTRPPQLFKVLPFDSSKYNKIKEDIKIYKYKVFIHGSYLLNLCKTNLEDYVYKVLTSDLEIAEYIGAVGVIIHMGHNTEKIDDKEAFNNYIKHLKKIISLTKNLKAKIILETGAGQGKEIATRINELGMIRKRLTETEKTRVGFCIDTCHIFSAGYDLRNLTIVKSLENYIDITLGWANVDIIHFNDSSCKFNCRKDRHATITTGYITNKMKYIESFKELFRIFIKHKVPIILETDSENHNFKNQLAIIISWLD